MQNFLDLFDAAEKQGKLNEEAWVDKALLYHRYRADVLIADDWKELTEATLNDFHYSILNQVTTQW